MEFEAQIMCYLKGHEGIPEVISYGQNEDYNILIMELLGENLNKLLPTRNKVFSIKTTCMIGIQIVRIIIIL